MKVSDKLDALLQEYELKGYAMSASLQPGLSPIEIQDICSWFPVKLPELLIEMYEWRNGQAQGPWEEKYPFWFRDVAFSSLNTAEFEYNSLMDSYGALNNPERDGIDLSTCFPFAALDGGWYVLPCAGQNLDKKSSQPVISVLEGIEIYFHSINSMLDTCIDWVKHTDYSISDHLEREIELEIWRKHNPGIFT